jgi:hypothetical protein
MSATLRDVKIHLLESVLELFAGQPEVAVVCLEPGEKPDTFVLWGPSDYGLGHRRIEVGNRELLLDCRPPLPAKVRAWLLERGFTAEDFFPHTRWVPPNRSHHSRLHPQGLEDLPSFLQWAVGCLCMDKEFADGDGPTAAELADL